MSKRKFFFILIMIACLVIPGVVFGSYFRIDKFPRLANLFFRWDITEAEAKELAKWDILLVDMEVQTYSPQSLVLLKKLNPEIKILAYLAPQEIRGDSFKLDGTLRQKLISKIPDIWWLKNRKGEKVAWWPGNPLFNITSLGGKVNGQTFAEMFTEFINKEILAQPYWDGVFLDNIWSDLSFMSSFNIDANNDGRSDDLKILNEQWEEGMTNLLQTLQKSLGKNKILVGNGGEKFNKYLNGVFFEHFPQRGWVSTMKNYSFILQNGKSPTLGILNSNVNNSGRQDDYRRMRYGLASALLFDGFFSFDNGDASHNEIWWYDEYEVFLGKPLGSARNILKNNRILAEGVWRRDFENGVVLLNSTNQKRKVFLGAEYEKISGSQDRSVNNGLFVSELYLDPYDGIILLSRLGEIKNSFYANGSFVRIFNGEGNLSRGGFFSYNKMFRGGVQLMEKGGGRDRKFFLANESEVRVYDSNGVLLSKINPFGSNYKGGISLAVGDVDGDGRDDLIVGKEKESPEVKVFDSLTGKEKRHFWAYATTFKGGLSLAVCDLNNDGVMEIVTGAGFGGGPHVRIFRGNGKIFDTGFFPFDKKWRSGVNVACANVDNDKGVEIIVGATVGNDPIVKTIDSRTHKIKKEFLGFEKENKSGVRVSTVDFDGSDKSEIIVYTSDFLNLFE